MKLHVFLVLAVIFISFSCTNKVESIDVKNLKSPCECAHAAEIVINEQIDIREETIGKDFKDLDTSKLMPRVRNYMKKQKEIINHCKDKLAIGKCPEWKSIQEKVSERNDKITKKAQEEAIKKAAN
jgi:hypothetical protein